MVLIILHHLILIVYGKPTYEINCSSGTAEKKFSINFIKTKTNFCLSMHYNGVLTLSFMRESAPPPSHRPCQLFFYHINLNGPINSIFSDFNFYRFINILAKFGRSSPGQFGARTSLSKTFSKFFVLWSLKVFLSFNCLYLGLYYLKVVCTQFFRYLFQDWLFHLKIFFVF